MPRLEYVGKNCAHEVIFRHAETDKAQPKVIFFGILHHTCNSDHFSFEKRMRNSIKELQNPGGGGGGH